MDNYDFPKIGKPATRALINAGYTSIEQLTKVREQDLHRLHGMGPKGIAILRNEMERRGLSFKE